MREVYSKTIEVRSHIPARLNELWLWFEAVYEWDWGDPGLLAALIREEQIPPEFQIAVADIIEGVRSRPNYGKSVVSAQVRLKLATVLSELAEVRDTHRSDKNEISRLSEETRHEPIEWIHGVQKAIRNDIELAAKKTGASIETVKKIRREFQARVKRWPTV